MARIRRWAAVAAFLMASTAANAACQLSLLGAITQQPITYNPFQAGATTAAVSFTVKNADSKPCNMAFAFFEPGAPQANSPGGGALTYRILNASGVQLTQNATASPGTLAPNGNASYVTVGANQTYVANAIISIGQGQVVGPGIYTDQLFLAVYQSPARGPYTKAIPDAPLNVAIGVNSQMTVTVAGGGLATTLDFGNLVEGATRSVQLLAYSNQSFHLTVTSDNAGVMKLADDKSEKGGLWRVPYTVSIFRAGQIDLAQKRTVSLWPTATQRTGLAIPIDVRIGSIAGLRAGLYRDVITIAIDPGP